jgi:hypothetical protein
MYYLSCCVVENEEKSEILILQPHLIRKTPGTPRFKITCPGDELELIDVELQMRLYLAKYSRTGLCNVVRELSKCMDKAKMRSYLEILRVVKFVIDTKTFFVRKFAPKLN